MASAHGGHRVAPVAPAYYYPAPAVPAYYYPAPVYYEPVFPVPVVPAPCPVPVVTPAPVTPAAPIVVPYAAPSAAPPSAGPSAGPPSRPAATAPAAPPAPTGQTPAVQESRSFYDAAASRPRDAKPALKDRVRAGFWNLTGGEVTLRVEGQNYTLAPNKNLRLDVSRRFVWREGENKPQTEQVPPIYPSVEIVLRR
jgi:hypothetical protein